MDRREAIAAELPRLRRYARALVGEQGDADDLVQECLVRALRRHRQWRRGESPRKWLFAILHNVYVDGVRRRAKRPGHVTLEDAGEALGSRDSLDPAMGIDIERGLRVLSEEQRQTVLLVGLEGLSYAETADILGVPIGTVMSRLARGRERLRQHLQQGLDHRPPLTRIK